MAQIRYEVKADRMACRTGNIAIEYMCNNVVSGISSTRAKYYIYFVINPDSNPSNIYDIYKIKTKVLKQLVGNCRSVSGGDGNRSKMYLLKIKDILEYKINV